MSSPNRSLLNFAKWDRLGRHRVPPAVVKGAPSPSPGLGLERSSPTCISADTWGTDMVNWLELAGIIGTSSRRRHSTERRCHTGGRAGEGRNKTHYASKCACRADTP